MHVSSNQPTATITSHILHYVHVIQIDTTFTTKNNNITTLSRPHTWITSKWWFDSYHQHFLLRPSSAIILTLRNGQKRAFLEHSQNNAIWKWRKERSLYTNLSAQIIVQIRYHVVTHVKHCTTDVKKAQHTGRNIISIMTVKYSMKTTLFARKQCIMIDSSLCASFQAHRKPCDTRLETHDHIFWILRLVVVLSLSNTQVVGKSPCFLYRSLMIQTAVTKGEGAPWSA